MGVKRLLGEEDFQELSFKHPKQLDNSINLTSMKEDFSSHITAPIVQSPGETVNNFFEFHFNEVLGNGGTEVRSTEDKELEGSAPLSLVTTSGSEEDAGNEDASFVYDFPGYVDLSIPRRPPMQFQDPYVFLLNSAPRKEIPLGPDYQAEIPQWDLNSSRKDYLLFDNLVGDEWEQKLMGTCVSPMPALNDSSIDGVIIGQGRADCSCMDVGSKRCVQQHIKEAREKLRETVGDGTFKELGFYDMGEEAACNWSIKDEQVFHEVVFSNPASVGRDFWKQLSNVFLTRSKKELVSYYFNIFMLRRREFQNRSYLLEIDSDNDEDPEGPQEDHCQKRYSLVDHETDDEYNLKRTIAGDLFLVGEDEDSTVDSFGDQDLDTGWVDDYGSELEHSSGQVCGGNSCKPSPVGDIQEQDGVLRDGRCGRIAEQETKN